MLAKRTIPSMKRQTTRPTKLTATIKMRFMPASLLSEELLENDSVGVTVGLVVGDTVVADVVVTVAVISGDDESRVAASVAIALVRSPDDAAAERVL